MGQFILDLTEYLFSSLIMLINETPLFYFIGFLLLFSAFAFIKRLITWR